MSQKHHDAGQTEQQQHCIHYWVVESPEPGQKFVDQDCQLCGESRRVPAFFGDDYQFHRTHRAIYEGNDQ